MKHKRRGMFLIEMGVSGVLLMAFMMLCMKYFYATATQRRILDQRQAALLEASNVIERLSARPFDDLTSDNLAKISLSAEIQSALPDAQLKIDLADEGEKPKAKRLSVLINWQDQAGQAIEPVRLTTWRYQP